jgi:hypothetical protein
VFEDTASALLGVDGLQVTGVEAAPGRRHRGVSGHGVRGRGGLSGGGTVSDRVHETVIPRPVTSRAGPPGDETILEAALATVTTPSGQPGTPITPAALADALDWSLKRLDTALAALTDHLAGTGIRIDTDPAPASTPLLGLCARDRHLTDEQRAALHRLRHATAPLDADPPGCSTRSRIPAGPSPRATPPTRPPSSPSSSAGSSAAGPAPATSSSPTTPGSPSRQSRPPRTGLLSLEWRRHSHPDGAATLISVSFHICPVTDNLPRHQRPDQG